MGDVVRWAYYLIDKRIAGTTLPRKLILAIDERDRQVAAFVEVDRTLRTELRKTWQGQIDEWRKDKSKPNPYAPGEDKDGRLCRVIPSGRQY